jgi:hypothetical protein
MNAFWDSASTAWPASRPQDINQLDVVLAGRATLAVWLKAGLTYLVPFCVANWGILVASRRPRR